MASALPAAAAHARGGQPATGATWANCRWPMRQISTALDAARRAFRCGAFHAAAARRGAQGAARLMLERQEDLARIATLEEGKTLAEARIEVLMNVGLFKFYAGEVFRLYGRALVRPTGMRSTVCTSRSARSRPLRRGISRWAIRAQAGRADRGGLFGHPQGGGRNAGLGAGRAAMPARRGLPPEVAQAVFGVPDEVSRHLLASPVIRKLSSPDRPVGKHLASWPPTTASARPWNWAAMARCWCSPMPISTARSIPWWPRSTATPGRSASAPRASSWRKACSTASATALSRGQGDPRRQRAGRRRADGADGQPRRPEAMERLIGDATARGAKLHAGGERVGNAGFFYAPSVLSEIPLDAAVLNEEPFGPVALLNPFRGETP
jgi:succinate-semialdehyde dehydrogenase/glutarate-semialdehyde dehydrogenase